MKRKKSSQQTISATHSDLPDECWESIFKLVVKGKDENNNRRNLNYLSVVSKQFLSITYRLRFSLNVYDPTELRRLFQRYTNLTSINFSRSYTDLDKVLCIISRFPLKLTSLNLSNQSTIPANGLRAFSKSITTLTSLTCSKFFSFNATDLILIAECFPLLEELDLSYPSVCKNYNSYLDGVKALSKTLFKLRKVNLSGFPKIEQSLFHLLRNCKLLREVIMFGCKEITTITKIASALRERPTLTSLSFSTIPHRWYIPSTFINSLVSLKGLTCLDLKYLEISDELLYSTAREGLPLTSLVLQSCTGYSYVGMFCMLSKCQKIQHLDLQNAIFLNDQHVINLSLLLGDLVSINLSHCRKITKSALFTLAKNCPSLCEIKMERIGNETVENSESSTELGVYPQLKSLYLCNNSWLSDENIITFASIFPNLQLLDLSSCDRISKAICQVLRRCCSIRHLNLAEFQE